MFHRKNLILNDTLTEEAKRISGQKTTTATIHHALNFFIEESKQREQIEKFQKLRGSKCWVGNLKQLRKSRV